MEFNTSVCVSSINTIHFIVNLLEEWISEYAFIDVPLKFQHIHSTDI
jgi:hypothetical protein